MKDYQFAYGKGSVTVPLDERSVLAVLHGNEAPAMQVIRAGLVESLENPIGAKPLREEIPAGARVALVVSDMSRGWMRQDLVIPLLVRYIMNSVGEMPAQEANSIILKIGIGMLALLLVQLGSRYFITYYGHMMGAYIEHDMRNEIFSHYQKLSFAIYDNQKVGHLLSRITSDLFDITELLHHGPEDILISVIKLFGALIILMNVKPQMALLCFAIVIIMLIYALVYNNLMNSAFKENRVRMGEINSQIEDSLSGIRVVKSFGNEKREIEKFRKGNERFVDAKRVTYRYMAGYPAGMEAFTTLITDAA